MTVLITGGTGRTGLKLAKLLHESGNSVLLASRSGVAREPFPVVKFDWLDPSTFESPFTVDSKIDRVYIMFPNIYNALDAVGPFIDLAVSKGVKRFVLLGASGAEKGEGVHGKVHEYLEKIGVEYTALRPTWFIENFGTNFYHTIRSKNEIFSVVDDGRIPFVGTGDIARAAYDALVAEKSPNTDVYIVGPTLYTYDQAVAILSKVLGREITHRRVTDEQELEIYTSVGMTPEFARLLNGMEQRTAGGSEERAFKSEKAIIGREELKDYFEANKQLWVV